MAQRHEYADLIIAWANGAEIQYRNRPNEIWRDANPQPSWAPGVQYRIKPTNVVRWLPVMQMPAKSVVVGWGVTSKDCAGSQTDAATELKAVLRVEINPDTLELVSATMEEP